MKQHAQIKISFFWINISTIQYAQNKTLEQRELFQIQTNLKTLFALFSPHCIIIKLILIQIFELSP